MDQQESDQLQYSESNAQETVVPEVPEAPQSHPNDTLPLVRTESVVHSGIDQSETEVYAQSVVVSGNQQTGMNGLSGASGASGHMQQSTIIQQRAHLLLQKSIIKEEDPVVLEEQEPQKGLDDGYFYPEDHNEHPEEELNPELPLPIHPDTLQFYDCYGMDSNKKNNLWLINDNTFAYSSAISYHFYNFRDGNSQIFFSRDGGGIGSLTVHPTQKFYSVAEKGTWPNVYIYTSDHRLYRILRKGTERSYSNTAFTKDGLKLATVGSSPDYQICIWDWQQETILLKAKAFSQEVYKVRFSEFNPNLLATSGMGHIKFWKVAETFTGLKLKGEIGKFGQVELSDVFTFYQFPDGKILSGTEYGRLILWEGNVIKLVIGMSEEEPCHKGSIEVLFKYGEYIISGAKDGWLRAWRMSELDTVEGDDHLNYYAEPVKSMLLQDGEDPALILQVVQGSDFWLVGDQAGRVWRVDWENNQKEIVYRSNSGAVNDLALSSQMNAAITVGEDGGVRLWDYVNNNLFYERKFTGKATCIYWMPFTIKSQGRVVAVGFSNGLVRFLLLKQTGFFLLKAFKVHPNPIMQIKASSDNQMVAVLSTAGEIFFIKYSDTDLQAITPHCLWETKLGIRDMTFNAQGSKVLMGCSDGKLYEADVPLEVDNSENYLVPFVSTSYLVRMMESQKPKKEDMDLQFLMKMKEDKMPDVEWDPEPIMNVSYYNDKIICTVDGKYIGCCYVIDTTKDRPIELIPIEKVQTQTLSYSDDVILIGYTNGKIDIRHKSDFNKPIIKQNHDMDYGKVRKVCLNYDRSAVLSIADDGTLYVYRLDFQGFLQQLRGQEVTEFTFPELQLGINSTTYTDEIQLDFPDEEDILDDKIYSIQQAKLLAEEDYKKSEADKKKDLVRQKVQKLRDQFQQVRMQNQSVDEASKLTEEELCVDEQYKEMLLQRVEEDLEEARKELEWDQEYARLKTKKIKSYMIDELEIDKFIVKSLKNGAYVQSFKVKKLSEYLKEQLRQTYRLIEEERKNQEQQEIQQPQEGGVPVLTQQLVQSQVKIQHVPDMKDEQQNAERQEEGKLSQAKIERERVRNEQDKIRKEQDILEKTKPTKESFEPDHLRDIQEAIETLGDFKLKSSKDYVVPENQRMNVSKKRKHMFMLEEFIYNTKLKFNQQLLNLKQRKVGIVDKIKKYNTQIMNINMQLGKTETLFAPEIDKELEDPLSFLEISDEQINEFILKQAQQGKKEDTTKRITAAQIHKPGDQNQAKLRKGIRVQQSQLEDEMKVVQEMILQAEKARMLEEIQDDVQQFDRDVVKCQNEKNVLESDMLIAQMKLVTFFQELIILEDMEDYDNKLIKELLDFKKEKNNLDQQNEKIVDNLIALSKKEQSNEKELNEQMKAWKELVFPDDDVKREKLHAFYFKRYKKEKAKKLKKQQENDNSDSDEDKSDDEDEDDDQEFDSEEDDEDKPDISPVENDLKVKEVIEKICELEDNQEQNRKEKQDNDRMKIQTGNKIQQVLKELKRADDDLRTYQRKKLQKVNQLDVSFVLKLSQIQNLNKDTHALPADLQHAILFTEQEYYRLCKRIIELEQEQKKIEKSKKQKEKTKLVFEKEIKQKDIKIEDLNKKYEEKHMLKFGDIIDLKILDALEPTKQVLDARQQFQQEEKECIRKVARAKDELSKIKQALLEVKRENTKIFNNITKLGRQQMELSKKLTSGNKQLFKGESKQKRSDLNNDKQNLEDLTKYLSKEIEDLKQEIGLYKTKGGHIYTNVTATKQNFAQK